MATVLPSAERTLFYQSDRKRLLHDISADLTQLPSELVIDAHMARISAIAVILLAPMATVLPSAERGSSGPIASGFSIDVSAELFPIAV